MASAETDPSPPHLLRRIRYQWNGTNVERCFAIVDGEPVPSPCIPLGSGLGDVVALAAKTVGVQQRPGCGCAERRARLNQATPGWVRRILGRLGLRPGSPAAPPGRAGGPGPR